MSVESHRMFTALYHTRQNCLSGNKLSEESQGNGKVSQVHAGTLTEDHGMVNISMEISEINPHISPWRPAIIETGERYHNGRAMLGHA